MRHCSFNVAQSFAILNVVAECVLRFLFFVTFFTEMLPTPASCFFLILDFRRACSILHIHLFPNGKMSATQTVQTSRTTTSPKRASRKGKEVADPLLASYRPESVRNVDNDEEIDFFVFRAVAQPTDKVGMPLRNKKGEVIEEDIIHEDFTWDANEFFMDAGESLYDQQWYTPLVVKMGNNGQDRGRVELRSLQPLWFPWGIDGNLPVTLAAKQPTVEPRLPTFEEDETWTESDRKKAVFKAARERGIDPTEVNENGNRQTVGALRRAIKECDDRALEQELDPEFPPKTYEPGVSLPLYRVKGGRNIRYFKRSKERRSGQSDFQTGEIVLVFGRDQAKPDDYWVRDYLGQIGIITADRLERIDNAFGLQLDAARLKIMFWYMEGPDDLDEESGAQRADPPMDNDGQASIRSPRGSNAPSPGNASVVSGRRLSSRSSRSSGRRSPASTGDDNSRKRASNGDIVLTPSPAKKARTETASNNIDSSTHGDPHGIYDASPPRRKPSPPLKPTSARPAPPGERPSEAKTLAAKAYVQQKYDEITAAVQKEFAEAKAAKDLERAARRARGEPDSDEEFAPATARSSPTSGRGVNEDGWTSVRRRAYAPRVDAMEAVRQRIGARERALMDARARIAARKAGRSRGV